MNFNIKILIFKVIVLSLVLSSCSTKEKMVYFQSKEPADTTQNAVKTKYSPVFKKDDFIDVIITSDNTKAAIPFNYPNTEKRPQQQGGYETGTPATQGYLIDEKGNVTLPVIGKFKIAGLKRNEAIKKLQKKYSQYLSNPIVNIQIKNFKVTVLGDVNNPGTFTIPNERITILEAIGLAGDLKITGSRKNILVIRDKDGKKTKHKIDLTSDKILSSPVYYLEQNDVVYIEPNKAARAQGTFWRKTGTLFISITSLVITTISIIVN